jgi:hypothetical protein
MDTLDTSMDTIIEQKTSCLFECKTCDYITCKKSNYERHILSTKHKRIHCIHIINEQNEPDDNIESNKLFICICGNKYKWSQGLSKHKKSCSHNYNNKDTYEKELNKRTSDKNEILIQHLLKENKEIKELLLEIIKNGTKTNIHNN